ncbi:MAG: glycosyltransferase [Nitrososphaerota archaeon]
MNKCILVLSYGGGFENWRKAGMLLRDLKLIKAFSSFYDGIWVFTYDYPEIVSIYQRFLPANVKIIPRPKGLPKLIYSFLYPVLKINALKGVKIIRTWQFWGSWTALLFKLLLGGKLLLRQGFQFSKFVKKRGRLLYYLSRVAEKLIYHFSDKIITTTESDALYIIQTYRIPKVKVRVIPNGVDIHLFRPMEGIPKQNDRIIFVGRLVEQKNVLSLIEAVKDLKDVELYICGAGPLEEEIRRRNVPNVKLLGVIPQRTLPIELNKSEIFVLPSLYEGHPKALLEAMACGLPVIGSRVEGIRELIKDGVNGLLCDPSPEDIRRKLIHLLSDKRLREELGRNAREYVVRNYSLEKIFAEELKIHRELLLSSSQ